MNELEGFAAVEQLALVQDEIQRINQINAAEKIVEEKQQETDKGQLIQLQQSEHVAFILQQLHEN